MKIINCNTISTMWPSVVCMVHTFARSKFLHTLTSKQSAMHEQSDIQTLCEFVCG